MNANTIMYALNNRVKELNGEVKRFKEIENALIELTGYDLKQLQTLFAAGYTLEPPKKDPLVIRLPVTTHPDDKEAIRNHILKQMEQGVVVLPNFIEVVRLPDNIEFKFE